MVLTDVISSTPVGDVPVEAATFCADADDKVPTWVGFPNQDVYQVCPELGTDDPAVTTVTNADPLRWQVRAVFDELLDPDIEDLTDSTTGGPCTDVSETCDGHFTTTQPFELECEGTAVDYDGYYVPNGNLVSWPPGPSLVVFPLDFIATSSACTVTLRDNITDKDGNPVPGDDFGPYDLEIAPLAMVGSDPAPAEGADPAPEIASDAVVVIAFNAFIDETTATGDITLSDGVANVAITITADDTNLEIAPTAGFVVGTTYTLTIPVGATFADTEGGPLTIDEAFELEFDVVAP